MTLRLFLIMIILANGVQAQSLANGANNAQALIGTVNQTAPLSSDPKAAVPGFVSSSPAEVGYSNGNMSDAATQKSLTDPAAQLIHQSFTTRPDIKIDRANSPIFNNAKRVTDNPNAIVDSLTGSYGECRAETSTTTSSDIRTCDEYTEIAEQSCQVGTKVTVDAEHQYKCNRSRVYNDYTCNRALNLTCESPFCDANAFAPVNIVPNTNGQTPAAALGWSYNYPTLDISGTWQIKNGSGSNGEADMCAYGGNVITFNVNDISKVTKFMLTWAYYKSTIDVKLNGTLVFSDNGLIEHQTYTCYIPQSSRYSLFQAKTVSINLLPYLRQGSNTFSIMGNSTYGTGEARLKIDTVQQCCTKWNESWTDNCTGYK